MSQGSKGASRTQHLFLLRHGKTSATNPNIIYGRQGVSLSDEGREQMKRLSQGLPKGVELIFHSPIDRTTDSAQLLAQGRISLVSDEDLLEIDFGEYSLKDVTKHPDVFIDKYSSSSKEFPGGESKSMLQTRAKRFHARVLERQLGQVCVVSHQWLLSTYLKHLLGCDPEGGSNFVFHMGKVTHVELTNGEVTYMAHNVRSFPELP